MASAPPPQPISILPSRSLPWWHDSVVCQMQQLPIHCLTSVPLISNKLQDPHLYCSRVAKAIGCFSNSQHGIMTSHAATNAQIGGNS